MAITHKTRKILWARSGNRCAICRRELVTESNGIDDEAIIGEECHIVAREVNGPRGNSLLPISERDKPANLILLCRNHHKEIDDQVNTFTEEVLRTIKAEHEAWVREKLTTRKKSGLFVFFAFRVDSGTQFCNLVVGCDAFHFNNDQPKTQEEAELIGNFLQRFQDYSDIWSEIESKDKILAQFEFDRQISELNEQGFVVYATERDEQWEATDVEKSLNVTVGYILILRKNKPIVKRKDDEVERLMRIDGQNKCEFTNFIPVMHKTSSVV